MNRYGKIVMWMIIFTISITLLSYYIFILKYIISNIT